VEVAGGVLARASKRLASGPRRSAQRSVVGCAGGKLERAEMKVWRPMRLLFFLFLFFSIFFLHFKIWFEFEF
jgi:hypothetical protein